MQPLSHGGVRFHTALPPPQRRPPQPPGLNLRTYNIRYSFILGLLQAIQAVNMGNYDVMLLAEWKISEVVYCKTTSVKKLFAQEKPPPQPEEHRGVVGLVTKEILEVWGIYSTRFHIPNVMNCEIVPGLHWTPLIISYLPLTTLDQLPNL